jgi:hypothetical protein
MQSSRALLFLLLTCSVTFLAMQIALIEAQSSDGYIAAAALQVPYASRLPDVSSGVCQPDQWKDGMIVKVIPNGDSAFVRDGLGYLMLKYDAEGLYGCVDIPSQKDVGRGRGLSLKFDTAHDGWPYSPDQKDNVEIGAYITNVSGIIDEKIYLSMSSITRTPLNKVVMKASVGHSPNIGCDKNDYSSYASLRSCHLTEGSTQDSNLMNTFFVPIDIIEPTNANYPNTIGFYFVNTVVEETYGFAYPKLTRNTDSMYWLTDLIFLPQVTTTTVSLTSTTTQSATLTTTKLVTITTTKEVGPSIAVWGGVVAIVVVCVGALAYLSIRNRGRRPSIEKDN